MISFKRFSLLSLGNLFLTVVLIGWGHLFGILFFFSGLMLNQIFLIFGVKAMLAGQKKSFLLVAKLFILIAAFYYATRVFPGKLLLCVLIYIFQLIILSLSIKRNIKN